MVAHRARHQFMRGYRRPPCTRSFQPEPRIRPARTSPTSCQTADSTSRVGHPPPAKTRHPERVAVCVQRARECITPRATHASATPRSSRTADAAGIPGERRSRSPLRHRRWRLSQISRLFLAHHVDPIILRTLRAEAACPRKNSGLSAAAVTPRRRQAHGRPGSGSAPPGRRGRGGCPFSGKALRIERPSSASQSLLALR
jgi:hypothetical protein